MCIESPIDDGMDPEVVARAMQLFDFLHMPDPLPEGYQPTEEPQMTPEEEVMFDSIMMDAVMQCIPFEVALEQYRSIAKNELPNRSSNLVFDATPLECVNISIFRDEKG